MKIDYTSAVGQTAATSLLFAGNAFMCYQGTAAKVAAVFAASEVSTLLITEAVVGSVLTIFFSVTSIGLAIMTYMIHNRLLAANNNLSFWKWRPTLCQIN